MDRPSYWPFVTEVRRAGESWRRPQAYLDEQVRAGISVFSRLPPEEVDEGLTRLSADLDYVVPDETLLIENPIAVVNESQNLETARAFVDFLYTKEAQQIFADTGYRPVVDGVESEHTFPTPPKLFEITRFGGWDTVNDEFFDPFR